MPYEAGPFSDDHLYLQWGGKLPGGETWSNGVRLIKTAPGTIDPNAGATFIAAATTAVQAFHVRAGSMIHANAKLSFVKLNAIGEDGLYMQDLTTQQVVADVAGGTAFAAPANQVALVVTLETGFSRGPAHRGRFYMPMCNAAPDSTGLITTTDRTAIKTSVETFRTALNALSANFQLGVMSRKLGAPAARACTAVSVGRALDTQRRRRRSLLENY